MLFAMLIIGHIEIGNGYCRTDLLLPENTITTMEYPCEYYQELKNVDKKVKELVGEQNAKTY